MKKLSICFIFLAITIIGFAQSLGDANEDSNIDIVDALLVAQEFVGLNPPALTAPGEADVNCDGVLDIVDSLLIAQYYVGLFAEFPCPVPTETPDVTPEPTSVPTPTVTPVITPDPTGVPTPGLEILYMNAETNTSTTWIKPNFIIKNNGSIGVALSDLAVRYYFTCEAGDAGSLMGSIYYASFGAANITMSFVDMNLSVPSDGADTYVEYTFSTDAGTLGPGAGTANIQTAFHESGYQTFDQGNDFSYGTSTANVSWDRMTIHHNGILVWGTDPSYPPVGAFTVSREQAVIGEILTFDASASLDSNGTIESYEWDFGDGSSGSGMNTTHTYGATGSYIITLTVTDNQGRTDSVSRAIKVFDGTPFALFSVLPFSPVLNEPVTFDASASYDLDGTIVTYSWNFGDGATGNGMQTTHIYSVDTSFSVILTITDSDGKSKSLTKEIRIFSESGPFFEEYVPKSAPQAVTTGSAPPFASGSGISIGVDADAMLRDIPPTMTGNNIGVWEGHNLAYDELYCHRMADLDASPFRFPGGSRSNWFHWDLNYPAGLASLGKSPNINYLMTTIDFMEFVRAIGATPMITANYGYCHYDTTATDGTPEKAAAYAADWVEYCNSPNDGSNPNGGTDWAAVRAGEGYPEPFNVKYWEIGNEIYGSWEIGYEPDGSVYGANFCIFYDAMKAVDPRIYIGAVAAIGQESYRTWSNQVFSAPGFAERVDFLEVHDYFMYMGGTGKNQSIPVTEWLDWVEQVTINKNDLDTYIQTHSSRPLGDIKYFFGEYNCTNGGPETMQSQLVAGLFMAKALGEMHINNFASTTMWYSVGGGHGIMLDDTEYTPKSFYWTHWFFSHNFGDKLIQTSCQDPDVNVYASRFSGGDGLGIIIINESGSNKTATLTLTGFSAAGTVNSWTLTGADLESMTYTVNGIGTSGTGGGPQLADVVPYSWNNGTGSTITVNLEKYSVTSLLIY